MADIAKRLRKRAPHWNVIDAENMLEAATRIEALEAENRKLRAALAQAEPVQSAARVDAYDMIDRFLRNNLQDDDYAEYSAALDSLYTAALRQYIDGLKKHTKGGGNG